MAKIVDAYSLPRPKALPLVFLNLRLIPFGKHPLYPFEIITGRPKRLDEGFYKHILLKGNLLYYCKCLTELLKEHFKLVSEVYHSNLFLDEDQISHDVQPDYAYWKRRHLKESLQPRWKGPHQALLTSSCATKPKETDFWIHIFHLKRGPATDWSVERTADLKLTLKRCSNKGETTLTSG